MADQDKKRLFFGIEVDCPWPKLPKGRTLEPESRHLTLAFLGDVSFSRLSGILGEVEGPAFKVGLVGKFDKCLFLSSVVAWHVEWLSKEEKLLNFQRELTDFLREKEYSLDRRDFLSHVTLARKPFKEKEWADSFSELPVITKNICLYESVGNLVYRPIWIYQMLAPFEEIEHTADLAFFIRGEKFLDLQTNAVVALSFRCPEILNYLLEDNPKSLDEVIINLNRVITKMDIEIGSPFKAVSFHEELREESGILTWEMIVDV